VENAVDYGALNPEQLKAVRTIDGPLLIIAGAGSGKTRVITYRIAYMLERGIAQSRILALTFTNKAAREMESRIHELTGKKLQALTISTFHSFGVRLLRSEIEALGYRKNFSIYDETDKLQAVKDALKERGLTGDNINVKAVAALFSNVKTGLAEWGRGADASFKEAYEEYQKTLKVYNALDFDDLIVLPVRLFREFPDVLEKYKARYRYIMIDEFQDTSAVQYELMRLMACGNVCVVGDDDQSIYSWRGANYENISNFERDFPDRLEIKLEQNYRSTTTILNAANGVIAHNTERKDKKLWTSGGSGKAIDYYTADNETAEADFIVDKIRSLFIHEHYRYNDFGILLRTNSLLQHIEEALLEANMPYYVTGGMSFFERKEVKDVLSYLRVIANTDDDVNLLRVINTPRRGIGKGTIAGISELAKKNNCSLWNAMMSLRYANDTLFQETVKDEFDDFMSLIERQREAIPGKRGLAAKIRALVDEIKYHDYLVSECNRNEKLAHYKYLNIEMLLESVEKWENNPDTLDPTLYPYLNKISLIRSDDNEDAGHGKINLMTIHASKGLEFKIVFIAGCEEGIMPHLRSIEEDAGNIEEERRLFYVAVTRAREKLFITNCASRTRNKTESERGPSPFIDEIPKELIEFYNPEKTENIKSPADFLSLMKAKLQS